VKTLAEKCLKKMFEKNVRRIFTQFLTLLLHFFFSLKNIPFFFLVKKS